MTGSTNGAFVAEATAGQRDSEALIRAMACFEDDPDGLFKLIDAAIDPLDHSKAKLRGSCRGLQMFVERQFEDAAR